MPADVKQKSDRAIAAAANRVKESVNQIDLPTATEIKDLSRQANCDKEAASSDQHVPAVRARQGVTLGTMRYVWAISLFLAVLAMILVYIATIG